MSHDFDPWIVLLVPLVGRLIGQNVPPKGSTSAQHVSQESRNRSYRIDVRMGTTPYVIRPPRVSAFCCNAMRHASCLWSKGRFPWGHLKTGMDACLTAHFHYSSLTSQ
ncbi:unnamed protein product [Ectocarpus sp. 8 AP-2014]